MNIKPLQSKELYVPHCYLSANTKAFDMRPHQHPFLEINYQVEGKSQYWIDGKDFFLTSGDLLILDSSFPHKKVYLENQSGFLLGMSLHLREIRSGSEFSLKEVLNHCPAFSRCLSDMDRGAVLTNATPLCDKFQDLLDEYSERANPFRLKVLMAEILFLIDQLISKRRPASSVEQLHKRYAELIQFHINRDYREISSLKDLEGYMGLNSTYLERIFHEVTGSSIWQYVISQRLKAAADYLSTTDIPVGEIDSLVGMNSRQTFYLQFKKRYGMSPSEYRKASRRSAGES